MEATCVLCFDLGRFFDYPFYHLSDFKKEVD
jgi:hypothetical protein